MTETGETMTMTKTEREELAKILKGRRQVAKMVTEQRAAELRAQVEQVLASDYTIDNKAWKDLTAEAVRAVRQADAALAERCRELGIPEKFRPSIAAEWYGRGENADQRRRTELRRVACTQIDSMAKQARITIETRALDGLERLASRALESAEAQAFMAALPSIEALMPALDAKGLRALPEVAALLLRGLDDEEEGDITT